MAFKKKVINTDSAGAVREYTSKQDSDLSAKHIIFTDKLTRRVFAEEGCIDRIPVFSGDKAAFSAEVRMMWAEILTQAFGSNSLSDVSENLLTLALRMVKQDVTFDNILELLDVE